MTLALLEIMLAGLNVNRSVRDGIIGDLIEEHGVLVTSGGAARADRWMRRQVAQSIPFLVAGRLRAGGVRLLGLATGAGAAGLVVMIAVAEALSRIFARVGSVEPLKSALVGLPLDVALAIAAGNLAARLGRSAPLAAAFAAGALALAVSGSWLQAWDGPSWVPLTVQLAILPSTLAGGWLQARRLVRHAT